MAGQKMLLTKQQVLAITSRCGIEIDVPKKGQRTVIASPNELDVRVIELTDKRGTYGDRLYSMQDMTCDELKEI